MQVIIFTDINGNYGFGRNLGAYTVASYLRQHGISVQVVDFFSSLTYDELKEIVDKYISRHTDLVCFSNTFFQQKHSTYPKHKPDIVDRYGESKYFPHSDDFMKNFIHYILSVKSDIKFVMGGKKTRLYKHHDLIDHWVVGDGEVSLLKLIRGHEEEVLRFPYDGFNTFQMQWSPNDHIMKGEALPIEFSRGCPFRCAFCATEKRNLNEHVKPKDIIRDELIYNYEYFGTTRYMIVDLTFNETPERTRMYCDIFKSLPFKIEWSGVARLDIMSKYNWMADEMLESGAKSVWFGIESFNRETLLKINKTKVHPDRLKNYTYELKQIWGGKVVFGSLFIVGLPGEPLESVKSTFDWLMDDNCPLDAAAFYPLGIREPGHDDQLYSFIANDMKKYGYLWHAGKWFNIHTGMTQLKATEVAQKYTAALMKKRKPPPIYFYYSRLQTLGFTDDELSVFSMDYKESFAQSEERRELLKDKYIHKLLNV